MATERIARQQKDRETESHAALLQKKDQEVDVLKALLAKLQKYGRNVDDDADIVDQISLLNGGGGDQKHKAHSTKANTKREVGTNLVTIEFF